MFIEHVVFGISIAILAGTLTRRKGEGDYSWIIVVGAMAPDIDITVDLLRLRLPGLFSSGFLSLPVPFHGSLHTIGFLLLVAVGTGLILSRTGIRFVTAAGFAGIGVGSHLLEDALVSAPPGYPYLCPLSQERFMLPVFSGERDWFGVANTASLTLAVCLVVVAGLIRVAMGVGQRGQR
jgi:membrane-bound metal-dependent hydrolase YbcI (DUF457 family)